MPSSARTGIQLDAALAGDKDAWAAIVRQYTNLLWWIARSYRLDDGTAADVVQTVWLQLVRHGHSITQPERLQAWLATTARREALRQAQLATKELPSELEDVPNRLGGDVHEDLLNEELLAMALVAFKTLDPDDQRLLQLLCDVPPKSYEQIAALIGKSTGYIGPTRSRCLAKLRTEMKKLGMT